MRTHNKRPHSDACENEPLSSCRQTHRAHRSPANPNPQSQPQPRIPLSPGCNILHCYSKLLHQTALFYRALAFSPPFFFPILSFLDRWHSFMAVLLPVTVARIGATHSATICLPLLLFDISIAQFSTTISRTRCSFFSPLQTSRASRGTKLDDAFWNS